MAAERDDYYRLGMACVAVSTLCAVLGVLYLHAHVFLDDLVHALRLPPVDDWFAFPMYVWLGTGLAGAVCFSHSYAPQSPRIWLGSLPLFAFFAYIVYSSAHAVFSRSVHRIVTCDSAQRQIAAAMIMAAQDHPEQLLQGWEVVADLSESMFICPGTSRYFHRRGGFGMNAVLRGVSLGSVQDPDTMLLTADSVRMTSYLQSSIDIDYTRHRKYRDPVAIVSYLDGHAGTLRPCAAVRLR
jgi:hypothetical protein